MSNQLAVKDFFLRDDVKKKFQELLGQKSVGFITSVMQVVNNNNLLQKASPASIYNAAAMAATLDLPINQNLGFAWIVPYGNAAQFQIGWKGMIQLANRTGQYKAINVTEVYENQFTSFNRLTEELDADFSIVGSGAVVGYVAYFKLLNGFEKTVFWTTEEVKQHGAKFSKTFNQSNGVWKTNFDAMAKKTVLKNTLAKWGILSIEMQNAVIADSAIINDVETLDVEYIDGGEAKPEIAKPLFTESDFDMCKNAGMTIDDIRKDWETTPELEMSYNEYIKA
jgi:recombination protein RecT